MPIFEYECPQCCHREEHIEVGSEAAAGPLGFCPRCTGGVLMYRVISLPSYAKIKGSRVATTWGGKQGAAASV